MSASRLGAAFLIGFASWCGTGCSRNPSYYIDRGNTLFEAGKYSDAVLAYRKAIQGSARSGEAYYRLGLVEVKLKKAHDAYQDLTRAADLLPDRNDVKSQLGDVILRAYLADRRRPKRLYDELTRLSSQLLAKDPNSFDGLRFQA